MAEAVTRGSPLPEAQVAFWQRLDSRWLLIGVPIALVLWLSLVPLVFLLWQSFLTPQTASRPAVFTLENFETAYLSAETFRDYFPGREPEFVPAEAALSRDLEPAK